MIQIKHFIIFLTLLVTISGCEKDGDSCLPDPDSNPKAIVLNDLVFSGDSVTLSWSTTDAINFRHILIIRKVNKDENFNPDGVGPNHPYIIARISPDSTSFTDNDIPYASYVEYQIVGLDDKTGLYQYFFSNSKTYERSYIKDFELNPLQIIPDLPGNRLYFIEKWQGKISIFDLNEMKTVSSVTTSATIGYCSIGNNGNASELYVPRNDGWVFVYNPETLEETDMFYIGYPAYGCVNNNGKLFITTDRLTSPLIIFDRITKQIIGAVSGQYRTRMRIVPGSNSEILEFSIWQSPAGMAYYEFDENGNYITKNGRTYSSEYHFDHEITRFNPDGTRFITSSEGVVYDMGLNIVNYLPSGHPPFSDYAFNTDGSVIYSSCMSKKSIISYSYPELNQATEYKTLGYPHKIFIKDNSLICISKSIDDRYITDSKKNYIIEIIEL